MGICEDANEPFFSPGRWVLTQASPPCLGSQGDCQTIPPLLGGTICMTLLSRLQHERFQTHISEDKPRSVRLVAAFQRHSE